MSFRDHIQNNDCSRSILYILVMALHLAAYMTLLNFLLDMSADESWRSALVMSFMLLMMSVTANQHCLCHRQGCLGLNWPSCQYCLDINWNNIYIRNFLVSDNKKTFFQICWLLMKRCNKNFTGKKLIL